MSKSAPYLNQAWEALQHRVFGPVKVLHLVIFVVYFSFRLAQTTKSNPTATASHILVKTEELALKIKSQIESKSRDFASLAQEHSLCPSGKSGGCLGSFSKGDMVLIIDL